MTLILIISIILLLLGINEKQRLKKAQSMQILRIQVNGIRGKSTLVRMFVDLLAASGKKVCARVSGEKPEIFDSENGWRVFPRRGAARIKEVSRFLLDAAARKPDVIICENMALQAEYQWIFARIFCPKISVYTNLRLDHQEVMGKNKSEIAETLFFSLSKTGTVFFPDDELLRKEFKRRAVVNLKPEILSELPDVHDNVRNNPFSFHLQMLAKLGTQLKIEQSIIEETKKQWEENLSAKNFIETVSIGEENVRFINLFTCNDVDSARKMWNYILSNSRDRRKIAVILSCRSDRPLRTLSFLDWLTKEEFWQTLLIYGSAPFFAVRKKIQHKAPWQQVYFTPKRNVEKILLEIAAKTEIIIGMGNYLKSGERFIQLIREIGNGN